MLVGDQEKARTILGKGVQGTALVGIVRMSDAAANALVDLDNKILHGGK